MSTSSQRRTKFDQIPLLDLVDLRADDFLTRTRVDGGAGLGLAIAKAEINQAGGTISVEDRPLGGVRFTITVPAIAATPGSDPAAPGHSTF